VLGPVPVHAGSSAAARIRRLSTAVVSASMTDDARPIAWSALEKGAPVYAADGAEIGKVGVVIADEQKDIFAGISMNPGLFRGDRFVPADLIDEITAGGVRISLDSSEAADRLPLASERP
jgi:hypothetical protein